MTKRVLLVHNPEAGSEEDEADEIMAALGKAGHKAIFQSSKKKGLKECFKGKLDLVLVAGGDGTVGKVAALLVGKKIPLSGRPLGTANNLAPTLGLLGPVSKLIAGLDKGRPEDFDVGRARGPWGKRHFFEGAGAGLFADYL